MSMTIDVTSYGVYTPSLSVINPKNTTSAPVAGKKCRPIIRAIVTGSIYVGMCVLTNNTNANAIPQIQQKKLTRVVGVSNFTQDNTFDITDSMKITLNGKNADEYAVTGIYFVCGSDSKVIGGNNMESIILSMNKLRLDEFALYEDDWNGYGASAFSGELIGKMKSIIDGIRYQPRVFPTGRGSIQLEYREKNGKYLEIEIYDDEYTVEVFRAIGELSEQNKGEEFEINLDINEINKVVSEFYEN